MNAPTLYPSDKKQRWGTFLYYTGLTGFPITLGALLGYFAADRGMRFLPTFLELLITVGILCLILIGLGNFWRGRFYNVSPQGIKLRKRVVFCILLALLAGGARLTVFWVQTPSPLTNLPPSTFERFYEQDSKSFREYQIGLNNLVRKFEGQFAIFGQEKPDVLTPDQEKWILTAWESIYNYSFALDRIRVFYEDYYRFDPSRAERSYHLRSFLLTYAAELALFESSSRLVRQMEKNPNAVKFLNAPHPDAGLTENSFQNYRQELQGLRDQARVLAGKQYLDWLDLGLDGRTEAHATGAVWIWNNIDDQLVTVSSFPEISKVVDSVGSDLQILQSSVRRVWFPMQKEVSEWMGDTRVRRGKKYLITPGQLAVMDSSLEPGDVMISRKNWYLSNVGLPGFWPHAILYIGAPKKLQAYFDTPEVKSMIRSLAQKEMPLGEYLQYRWPHQWSRYQRGDHGQEYVVIEAISEGVLLNTAGHAAGDYLAALRPRLDKVAKAQAIIEAFGHLDKPYDFDFDFSTDHALVCTELVWRSYRPARNKKGITFPLEDIVGRRTLPANNMIQLFADEHGTENPQMDFVYFLDGREKKNEAMVSTVEALLSSHKRSKWSVTLE